MKHSWTKCLLEQCGVFFLSMERLLTIENNNVKLPIAEQLVLVGDAGPETASPPQDQSEQNLALLLVKRNGFTIVLFQTVIIHCAQLEKKQEKLK